MMMNSGAPQQEYVDLPSQEAGFSISELKQIIFRRWKPALAVGSVVFAGMFVPTLLETPLYRSETSILLENPRTQDAVPVAPGISGGSLSRGTSGLSTEILVLKSKSLISQAIEKYPNAFSGLSSGAVSSKLQISQAVANSGLADVLTISFVDSDPQRAREVLKALGEVYVDYSLEKQRSQTANAIGFIDEQLPESRLEMDKVAYDIRRFRQQNNLVDPDTYATGIAGFRQSLEQETNSIRIALERAKTRYAQIEAQIKALGQNPDTILATTVLSQDGLYAQLANQFSSIETEYITRGINLRANSPIMQNLKAQRDEISQELRKRANEVLGERISQKVLDQAIINSTAVDTTGITISPSSTPTLGSTVTQAGTSINSNLDAESNVNRPGGILSGLGPQLLAAQNEITLLESQIAGTSQAQARVENQFQSVPQLQETFTELQRQLQVKSSAVDFLLRRRQDLQIALAEESSPWKILDEPYLPSKPISPNIQRGLALALAGAGSAGVLVAWLLHQLDTRVKLIDEVKQITQLPLLGAVPKVVEPRIVLSNEANVGISKGYNYRYSSFTEAFRAIAMNLSYLMAKSGKIKSLVMTSSTSSEGKSTTSYNLALALTDLGSRVLLVDADMRKPKLHKLTQQSNQKGLTEVISSDEPWLDMTKRNVVSNLDVITAGSNVPNPIALLSSSKMTQLIQEWEAAYDYVIIDTPPIGVMADAQSLIHQVDTVLLVTGIERATQKSLSHTLEILKSNQCNLAGFVANFVEKDLDYYSYSYYSHYYNQPSKGKENIDTQQQSRRD